MRKRSGTSADLLVVGLGNPGEEYRSSRHNVGFEVVEELASRHGGSLRRWKRERALVDEVKVAPQGDSVPGQGGPDLGDGSMEVVRVALAEPQTFMNLSGESVRLLVRRFGLEDRPRRLVVVHDELDLPLGKVRIKAGGGLAGHKGLRSISSHLHTQDYLRVRIGVGKPPSKEQGADYVLKHPGKRERAELDVVVQVAADAVDAIATEGPEAAMSLVNGR